MADLIIAFSKLEMGTKIESLLTRKGYSVAAVCRNGAHVLRAADRLPSGIVICGGRFSDMIFEEFCEMIPRSFRVIVISSVPPEIPEAEAQRIVHIPNPLKVVDLVETIEKLRECRRENRRDRRPRPRAAEEERLIEGTKLLLMNKRGMTEDEAHRFLRKMSMDSGSSLKETAEKIRLVYGLD